MEEYNLIDEIEEIIYVCNPETYELLYLNRYGRKELDADNYLGKKCFEVIKNCNRKNEYDFIEEKLITWNEQPARMVILSTETKTQQKLHKIKKQQKLVEHIDKLSHCSKIEDENLFSDSTDNQIVPKQIEAKNEDSIYLLNQKLYRKRICEYNLIVQQSYNEIYEVNMSKDKVQLIYKGNSELVEHPSNFTVRETVQFVGDNYVHEDDKKLFFEVYHENILAECALGKVDGFEVEYRRKGDDGLYHWVESRIKRIFYSEDVPDSDDVIFLLMVKDISEKVLERQKLQSTENKFYMALVKTCGHICDIDIKSKTYHLTLNRDEFLENVPLSGNYDEQTLWINENLIHNEDSEKWLNSMLLENMLLQFEQGAYEISVDYRIKEKNGDYSWFNNLAVFLNGDTQRQPSILIISHDIQAQRSVEQLNLKNELLRQDIEYQKKIAYKDAIYRIIVEQTGAGTFEWKKCSENSDWEHCEDVFTTWEMASEFGFKKEDSGFFPFLLNQHKIKKEHEEKFRAFLSDENQSARECFVEVAKKEADYCWYKFTITIITVEDSGYQRMIGTMLDVDNEIRTNETLKKRAELDSLTGLLNQDTFYRQAEKLMEEFPERDYVMIVMDIDKFKVINDLYTRDGGNKVLVQLAQLIQKQLTDHDICARVYADVFYIFADCPSNIAVVNFIINITSGLLEFSSEAMLVPYFGISRAVDDATTVTSLCEMAGFAHKYIKENNYSKWTFYDETIRERILEEKEMEMEMENALCTGQFKVYLQPKYVIKTGKVVGAEALVRWVHPTKGMIPPDKFIPLFEKNGFILKMDTYVWEQVCIMLRRWIDIGRKTIPISVNVSRLHLLNEKFQNNIVRLIEYYELPKELVELELTESMFFDNLEHMVKVMSELRAKGFTLDMDDFGSGFSSLNVLKSLPINVLKIDRVFLDEALTTNKGKTIVKYIVAMAIEMNMYIVAEGVETIEQEKFLTDSGCDIAQGFLFSKPVPIQEFEQCY